MEITTAGVDVDLTDATFVVGVLADNQPAPGAEEALAGADQRMLDLAKFEGKSGQVLTLPHDRAKSVVFVGLGEEAAFESIRSGMGNAIRMVKTGRAVTNLNQIPIEEAERAVVEGAALGAYQFRGYKTEGEALPVERLELIGADDDVIGQVLVTTDATNLARDWVNTPALDKAPERLADRISAEAEAAGLAVEVWDQDRIVDEKLGALLGVAAGSDRPPRVVILAYRPEVSTTHLGLVGKGVTFDSGGLSLKTAALMEEMKDDMSGAAIVSAATIAIARLGLPVRVTTVVPLTDNAVGGRATRPGDILRPVAGPTIEVLNTDAEGRLILADGLGLVRRHQPDLIIDVATLTGAARVALGDKIAAVFGSDAEVSATVLDAASRAGEHFWEMPLLQEYKKSIESDLADLKNVSG
ncbi:MAG TPA: M17 family peptidase N-terminal domain-containing protein, partial [Acidimicrobiia bacterium]|nr:M17 family peptidase N-terminal domain-containing protein [Acidimicrobiia bacterium]